MSVDIREFLRSKADEGIAAAPAIPQATLSRARRRRTLSAIATSAAAFVVIAGVWSAINALRSDVNPPVATGLRIVHSKTVKLAGPAREVVLAHGSLWVGAVGPQSPSITRIDARTGKVLAEITPGSARELGHGLTKLTAGDGWVWAIGVPLENGTITAVPRGSATFSMGPLPAAPEGSRTVQTFSAQAQPLPPSADITPTPTDRPPTPQPDQRWNAFRIDAASNEVRGVYTMIGGWAIQDAAAGEGALWAVGGFGDSGVVYRIDEDLKRQALAKITINGFPHSVVVGGGSVWVAVTGTGSDANHLLEIDPATNKIVARIPVPGLGPLEIATDGNDIWATVFQNEKLPVSIAKVNAATQDLAWMTPTKFDPGRLVVDGGYVWFSSGGPIAVFDAATGELVREVSLRSDTGGFDVDDGALWTINVGDSLSVSRYKVIL